MLIVGFNLTRVRLKPIVTYQTDDEYFASTSREFV